MAAGDQVELVFLGCDGPALPAAAGWLMDELAEASADLGPVLVVVPGSRAQRRLTELLAERSEGRALVPPTIVTIGGLADRLMPSDTGRVAGGLESMLAWAHVLREADRALLSAVVPQAPGRDDWPAWWALAEQVVQASNELGAQLLSLRDVPDHVAHHGGAERWQALAELNTQYEALLAERGRVDLHAARRAAIEAGACGFDGPIVLLATADLQPVHERMLAEVSCPVHALVFTNPADAEGFDAFGGLVESYWIDRPPQIDDASLTFADRPADQALCVLDAIGAWTNEQATTADDITVGLGDASMGEAVARTLDLAGVPVRLAAGRPIAGSRPVLLLRALGEFATGLRFDKLAALLRHPDAEAHLTHVAGESARPWLTLLDQYATDHLAARPTGGWLGDPEQVRAMDAVYQAALSLLPDPVDALRPLGDWADAIGGALEAVYGTRKLNRHDPVDRPVVAGLEAIGSVLDQIEAIDAATAAHCTFAQAVALVAARLAGQSIPEPGGEPAVELVGFLELLLDDAPRLAITGMNEHHVPEPPRTSTLLPEGVRRELGLPGDTHRLARDGYALSAMINSRQRGGTRLIAGRRSLDGDPLLPSRLLLREDEGAMVRRVSDFVDEQGETAHPPPMLLTPGKHDRFLIPRPVLPDKPITSLRVTAFRDYLQCPYRFYLKHVLGLRPLDDRAVELDPGAFGTLAHEALCVLADDSMRTVDDPEAIAERLSMKLDHVFHKAYGRSPAVAARVQAEQVRYRLQSLASVHARMIAEGWRIVHKEKSLPTTIEVDGEPFTITGKVDRIDRHEDGRWRLIDYKTSDTGKSPNQTHLATVDGQPTWVDLQLPLYLDLSEGLRGGVPAELGYINLPKKVADTAYREALWSPDELQSARAQRDFVIRQVRAGVFWPPKEPPQFDDALQGVCADAAPNRAELIRASESAGSGGGDG